MSLGCFMILAPDTSNGGQMIMTSFDTAMSVVLNHEGGFINNPDDKGGPTNFGITEPALATYKGMIVSPQDIINLTKDEAVLIYKQEYWDKMKLDQLKSTALSTIIMDLAVLRGVPTVVRDLQHILALPMDGIMGPQTINTVNFSIVPRFIGLQLIKMSQMSFSTICQREVSQLEFLPNWLSRTGDLLNVIYTD